MSSFTTRVTDAWETASDHLVLALVPVVTALLNTEKIGAILGFDGTHIGMRFGLPAGIVDLWQFTSVPTTGLAVQIGIPITGPEAALLVPLGLGINAVLMAGYFGSIRDVLQGEPFDFATNVRQYFSQFLGYTLIPIVLFAPLFVAGMQGRPAALGPVLAIGVLAFFVGSYLFFATPYLLVLAEMGVVRAAKRSFALAIDGGPYFRYALGYMGFVIVTSVLITGVVVNLGIAGVLIGTVGVAPLGLTLNIATMQFVKDLEASAT